MFPTDLEAIKREKIILEYLEKEIRAMQDLHIPEDQLLVPKMMLRMQQFKLEQVQSHQNLK